MSGKRPPRCLQRILLLLLSARSREPVSGDLAEDFAERTRIQGSFKAIVWYLRQVFSFLPNSMRAHTTVPSMLLMLCLFTALCGLWLGGMGLLLQWIGKRPRHSGVNEGTIIAAVIIVQAFLTIGALLVRQRPALLYLSGFGCVPLFWLVSKALRGVIDGSNFEGYILLIALALLAQALLTLQLIVTNRKRNDLRT